MSQQPTHTFVNAFLKPESEKIIDCLINELNEKFLTDLGGVYGTSDGGDDAEDRTTIYDNNTYFGVGDDGTKTLPIKMSGGDGGYHVPGRLEVADHSIVKALVNSSITLLRSAGETEKIVLSPLPRYIIPCCGDEDHITNRTDENFKQGIVDGLGEVRRSLKDLIFGKKLRNFKIMDPLSLMYGDGDGDGEEGRKKGCWDPRDPIHPSMVGYDALVQGLMSTYEETDFVRQYTPQRGAAAAAATSATGDSHG
jgi:hypothetical protein